MATMKNGNGTAGQKSIPLKGRRLIRYEQLPSWSHDNEFIQSGYRAPGGTIDELTAREVKSTGQSQGGTSTIEEHDSFYRCWESVWSYAHNETVNIHTHLWGAVVAITAVGLHILGAFSRLPLWLHPITHHRIFYPQSIIPTAAAVAKSASASGAAARWSLKTLLSKTPDVPVDVPLTLDSLLSIPDHSLHFPWHSTHSGHAAQTIQAFWSIGDVRANDWSDWLGFASYLFGAVTVLTCSATFHTVGCHSRTVAKTYNKLDYIGIVAMIVGSFLPILHYGFYCHVRIQLVYSVLIVSLGAAAMYTVLSPKFTSPLYRPLRTGVFLALGLSAFVPVAHILQMYGYQAVSRTMGLDYLVAGGALYVVGASLYVARVPERFAPGVFDYVGASHQIFHCLILLAAFCHYVCVRRSYVFWHAVQAIAPSGASATHAVCLALDSLRHAP